ncbi:aminodeoxychorismate lyase, partial [Streptomyces sp. SID6041]|nr:aminodeoxychorismate lyase [Streptomyces sp. SID6041]
MTYRPPSPYAPARRPSLRTRLRPSRRRPRLTRRGRLALVLGALLAVA